MNESLRNGISPSIQDNNSLVPLQKKERINKEEEFRSVNTIPVMNKLLQSVVKDQLEEYVEENKTINEYQSDFRKTTLVRQH